MNKNIKKVEKNTGKSIASKSSSPSELIGKLDAFLNKRMKWMIWLIIGLGFLISLLLFDSRISLSGDDSAYIMRANDFLHSFKYPSFQGPLYPMVLSLLIAVFGVTLLPLKLLSLLAIMGFIYLFYFVFKDRISTTILVFSLLLLSLNSYFLYYASQTYSEAFYLFIEMLLFLMFFKKFISNEPIKNIKEELKNHALLAAALLALALTRSVGFSAVIAVFAYFTFTKQWRNLLLSIAAFSIFFLAFQGIKYMLWSDGGLQFSSQGSGLLQKDYYNPQAGNEDIGGLFTRLIENTNQYLSKHFMYMVGLRKFDIAMTVNPIYSILIVLLSLTGLIFSFKKNKYLFFTGLVTGSFLLVSFVVLQSKWDQSRLIIPVVPFLIMMLFSAIYYLSSLPKTKVFQFFLPFVAFVMLLQTLASTAMAVKTSNENSGKYGGFTPDWKNYMKASEWVADNLSKNDKVACRKPSISFIYGKGREFYGIMQLPNYSNETFLKFWKDNEKSIIVYEYNTLVQKQLTQEFVTLLKNNMLALLFSGDKVFLAEYANDSSMKTIIDGSKAVGLSYFESVGQYKTTIFDTAAVNKIYYPDSLLNQLKLNKVTHILTANLRRNNTKKDGMIINTVERYMAFIQEKYPYLFTKLVQVGDDNNEPATISKIEYEKLPKSK